MYFFYNCVVYFKNTAMHLGNTKSRCNSYLDLALLNFVTAQHNVYLYMN